MFFPRENFCTSKMALKVFRFWKFSRAIWSFFKVFYYKNPKLPVKFFEKSGRESKKYPWKLSKSIFFTAILKNAKIFTGIKTLGDFRFILSYVFSLIIRSPMHIPPKFCPGSCPPPPSPFDFFLVLTRRGWGVFKEPLSNY